MTNEDLKRFYQQYNIEAKDFVRLNADGKIPAELIEGGVGTTPTNTPFKPVSYARFNNSNSHLYLTTSDGDVEVVLNSALTNLYISGVRTQIV